MTDRVVSKRPCLNLLRAVLLGAVVLAVGCAAKPVVAQGTWTGTIGQGPKAAGVRFVLEDNNGKLTGQIFFQDPTTNEFLEGGTLTGTRAATAATWTTETDVVIKGTFEENKFTGTLEFPPEEGQPLHGPGPLTLTR